MSGPVGRAERGVTLAKRLHLVAADTILHVLQGRATARRAEPHGYVVVEDDWVA